MARRQEVLELAVLGMLHDTPMHGYELRKRITAVLGPFRAISYGSLYPALRDLEARGWIGGQSGDTRRARIVYTLTGAGKDHFQELLEGAGPEAWEDEGFAARLAFFARTERSVRLRILEGRRTRLEERLALLRQALTRSRERVDTYTLQLQEHGLEGVEHEVRWLSDLIDHELQDTPSTEKD
jgi:DNA-binding PadR family transcriptional regulator